MAYLEDSLQKPVVNQIMLIYKVNFLSSNQHKILSNDVNVFS